MPSELLDTPDSPDRFEDIFGLHRLELLPSEAGGVHIEGGEIGLLRFWDVQHGPLRLVVGAKRHMRDNLKTGSFLLLVARKGAVDIGLYNRVVCIEAGDALLLTAIEPLVVSTSDAFSGTWIELPIWWLVELFGGGLVGARMKLDGNLITTFLLRSVLARLTAAQAGDNVGDIIDVFGDILRRCLIIAGREGEGEEGQMARITLFVARNYRQEGLSPRDAAQALGCSLSNIHKCCASAGTTFGNMLAGMRLSVAAYRLTRDRQRISDIAFDCGFASVSHFCHAFKATHGVTPKTMRLRHSC
jgi:AraC-like DNA-binding protein